MVFFIFIGFGFGLGSAVSALIGNRLAARTKRARSIWPGKRLPFAAIVSSVLMVFSILLSPLLIALVSEPGAYRDAATRYLFLLTLAIPGFVFAYACNGALQAQGDSVSLTRGLAAAFVANVILNPAADLWDSGVLGWHRL